MAFGPTDHRYDTSNFNGETSCFGKKVFLDYKNPFHEKGPNEAYSERRRRKFENHGNQFRLHLLFESISSRGNM